MDVFRRGLGAVAVASAISFITASCAHSPAGAYIAVPVGGTGEMWIDSSRHLLFAVDCDGRKVNIAAFENTQYTPSNYIGVGHCPADFLVPPGSKTAFLPQSDNHEGIDVIDLESKTLLAPLGFDDAHKFGSGSVSSDPNVLYVTGSEIGEGTAFIYAIDLPTKSITNSRRFDGFGNAYSVHSVEFSPATNSVYAFYDEDLYSFDGGSLDITGVMPLGMECYNSVLHQESGAIYAHCNNPSSPLVRINPQDKTITPIQLDIGGGLAIDQGRGKIYATLDNNDEDDSLVIAVVDVKTDSVETRTIPDGGCDGGIVAFDANDQVAYLSSTSRGCTIAVPMG